MYKFRTILARWRAVHVEKMVLDLKPERVCECKDLKKALHFRRKVINDIAKKVTEIQNAGLGDFKIRDLNDEINKLLRERRRWEDQIVLLGGPNHKILDAKKEGTEAPGVRGYRYFGAARFLPGVKELFEKPVEVATQKPRAHALRNIEYFGLRDEDDGIILPLEAEAERTRIGEKVSQYNGALHVSEESRKEVSVDYLIELAAEYDRVEVEVVPEPTPLIPTQAEVEHALIERKKKELLTRYASDLLVDQTDETKRLLGRDD